ncbi:hypothetical protein DFJ74DRAFT_730712 [Hyaloraphidium curvatum]|nr:hypothetical protein DFJ74DRAFT_730712 [Hyaloraphidium curvatum]
MSTSPLEESVPPPQEGGEAKSAAAEAAEIMDSIGALRGHGINAQDRKKLLARTLESARRLLGHGFEEITDDGLSAAERDGEKPPVGEAHDDARSAKLPTPASSPSEPLEPSQPAFSRTMTDPHGFWTGFTPSPSPSPPPSPPTPSELDSDYELPIPKRPRPLRTRRRRQAPVGVEPVVEEAADRSERECRTSLGDAAEEAPPLLFEATEPLRNVSLSLPAPALVPTVVAPAEPGPADGTPEAASSNTASSPPAQIPGPTNEAPATKQKPPSKTDGTYDERMEKTCWLCGVNSTVQWRRMQDSGGVIRKLCNACALRIKRAGGKHKAVWAEGGPAGRWYAVPNPRTGLGAGKSAPPAVPKEPRRRAPNPKTTSAATAKIRAGLPPKQAASASRSVEDVSRFGRKRKLVSLVEPSDDESEASGGSGVATTQEALPLPEGDAAIEEDWAGLEDLADVARWFLDE